MPEPAARPADRRITITDLQAATDRGERWSMLTSYDTLTAGVFEQVWQDMAGLTTGRLPRFVKRYASLRETLLDATRRFTDDVSDGRYPDAEHSYT